MTREEKIVKKITRVKDMYGTMTDQNISQEEACRMIAKKEGVHWKTILNWVKDRSRPQSV